MAYGADATSFNPVPIPVVAKGSGGVPIGTVVVWAQHAIPADWIECNGQSTSGYPQLSAIVGGTVPDYRGYFLRGIGGSSAGLGVAQGDAIRNITGSITQLQTDWGEGYGAFYKNAERDGVFRADSNDGGTTGVGLDVSRVVPTAEENRPVNKAVKYIIKAK